MIDWPVVAPDVFLMLAALGLLAAPMVGANGGWSALLPAGRRAIVGAALLSLVLLAWSWRHIPGGVEAAVAGHVAWVISAAVLVQIGRLIPTWLSERLSASLCAFGIGALLTVGVFLLGPMTPQTSPGASRVLLSANPLVTVASAAGIDLLHLDVIYRTSPLAHRGIALPSWTTACLVYLITGIAVHGARRLRPWSH